MNFSLYFAVWNQDYLNLFLDVVIPSYLAPGNLPRVAQDHSITTLIHTNREGAQIIRSHPIYAKLNAIAPVQIEEYVDTLPSSTGKYNIMSSCHEKAILTFLERKSIAIMAMPDIVISNHSLFTACTKLSEKKKVVIYSCFLRVVKETFVPTVMAHYWDAKTQTLTINHRELLSFSRDHLHPCSQSQSLHHPLTNEWASIHFIQISPHCILAKSFHFHPYIMDLRQTRSTQSLSGVTLDSGLIEALGFRFCELIVLENSEDFAALEISTLQFPVRINQNHSHTRRKKLFHWMRWGAQEATRAHLLNYLKYTFSFQFSDSPPSSEELKESKRVFSLLRTFFWTVYVLRLLHPRFLAKQCLRSLGKLFGIDLVTLVKRRLKM
jgi:hypothetical protein